MPNTAITIYSVKPDNSASGRFTLVGNPDFVDEARIVMPDQLPTANQVLAFDGVDHFYWRTVSTTYTFNIVQLTGTGTNPTAVETLYQYSITADGDVTLPTADLASHGLPMFVKNSQQSTGRLTVKADGATAKLDGVETGFMQLEIGATLHIIWDNTNQNWIIV